MLKKRKKVFGALVVLLVLVTLLFKSNFLPFLFQLVFDTGVNLNQVNGKVNILLLGIGGAGHDGPDLTDTIIFASIDQSKDKITLVSIPRDLWVPDLNNKINTAYAIGENKKKGLGLVLTKSIVSKILNQPVEYGFRLDFSGFEQAVDLVGGLDVNVSNTLDDYQYPIDGKENDSCGHSDTQIASLSAQIASGSASELDAFPCRYIHIHFDKGLNHMDGKQALEYVRSRHAVGDEGSDFARSARQEKVIKAFKDKILSPTTLFNPVKLLSLYTTIKANVDTDIKPTEMDDFIRLGQNLRGAKIETAVIDYGDSTTKRPGLLINPQPSGKYNFEWVLVPRIGNGNFQEIQGFVDCELKIGKCTTSPIP